MVSSGCPAGGGGYPSPDAQQAVCICKCRFFWTGSECGSCPPGYGGLDCDRCAVGGAELPRCETPQCAERDSIPGEVVADCGGGAKPISLLPALRHKGIPATVAVAATSPAGTPQLRLPPHVAVQKLAGGGLAVEGAEAQLQGWLQLQVIPAAALVYTTPISVMVNISGSSCVTVSREITLRCPAPTPRVSGALPAASVPDGGGVAIPCPLSELTNIGYPFEVSSSPPGVVRYNHSDASCYVSSAGLPAQGNGTTAIVTVAVPGGGPNVSIPIFIDINPPVCPTSVHATIYVQLPPSARGSEHAATIPTDEAPGQLIAVGLVSNPRGVALQTLGAAVRVAVGHQAAEGTFRVRLRRAVSGAECANSYPVHLFWGPEFTGDSAPIREAVGARFERLLAPRALASIGSLPWCPEPTLELTQQPGWLVLSRRGGEWVLGGALHSAGASVAYVVATDCRGGRATLKLELYGVAGVELGPLPDAVYLEDTPLRLPLPRVISAAAEVNLTVSPQLDALRLLGSFKPSCPAEVTVSQGEGLSLRLGGPPARIADCVLSLVPIPDGCATLELLWRAEGAARKQLLPGVCAPDPPRAFSKTLPVRWTDSVHEYFAMLLRSVDDADCLEFTAAPQRADPWMLPSSLDVAGRAPRREEMYCQPVHGYTCQTSLSASANFCVVSLPDARVFTASEPVGCLEDSPCALLRNMTMVGTNVSNDDTMISMLIASIPPELDDVRFDSPPSDMPEVHKSAQGEVRIDAPLGRLLRQLHNARLVAATDFAGTVQLTVRGGLGTHIGAPSPLTVSFAPVNDPPRCSPPCDKLELTCAMFGGEAEDLGASFSDVDDTDMRFHTNSSSHGVRVDGQTLRCASVLALIAFYGFPISGSADVYATDPHGLGSDRLEVEVTYELNGPETIVVGLLTALCSLYGFCLLLFQPGVFAWLRNCRRRAAGDRAPPGALTARVGSRMAANLCGPDCGGFAISKAGGCGLQWLNADAKALTHVATAAGASGGEIARIDRGGAFIGVQPEGAEDPGAALLLAVVGPRVFSLTRGPAPVTLSVLHPVDDAALKLTLRLRHKGAPGSQDASLVWAAGISRLAARCCAGPSRGEYSGTARQVTEWAHFQRIVGPAACRSELVWTLAEGNSERPLIGGVIPIGSAGQAVVCGGEDAAFPRAPGADGAARAAGGEGGREAGAPTDRVPNPLSEPLLDRWSPVQQQQRDGTGRPVVPPPAATGSSIVPARGKANLDQVVAGLQMQIERLETRQTEQQWEQLEAHRRAASAVADELREARSEFRTLSPSGVLPRLPTLSSPPQTPMSASQRPSLAGGARRCFITVAASQ